MKIRDTRNKAKPRCEMCGETLINVHKGIRKFCRVCVDLRIKIKKNKRWYETNKRYIGDSLKKTRSINVKLREENDKKTKKLKDLSERLKGCLDAKKRILFDMSEGVGKDIKGLYKDTLDYNILSCKECKVKSKVIDCRLIVDKFIRRRECPKCKKRYSTIEVLK
jgi:hypothetical protein